MHIFSKVLSFCHNIKLIPIIIIEWRLKGYEQINNAVNSVDERFYYCLLVIVIATTDDDNVFIESWLGNRSR